MFLENLSRSFILIQWSLLLFYTHNLPSYRAGDAESSDPHAGESMAKNCAEYFPCCYSEYDQKREMYSTNTIESFQNNRS